MTTHALPLDELLPENVKGRISKHKGRSENPLLVDLFASVPFEEVSPKLMNIPHVRANLQLMFEGYAETFSSLGINKHSFWTINPASSDEVVYWVYMYKMFGDIVSTGRVSSIKSLMVEARTVSKDDSLLPPVDKVKETFEFVSFLKDHGNYAQPATCYLFIAYASASDAIKLMARGITSEEYVKYCHLGQFTYEEIYESNFHLIPEDWLDLLQELD